MRLNNKGFAISSILYSILIMAIMLILGVLFSLFNRKVVFDKLKHNVLNQLDSNMNMSIATISVDPVLLQVSSDNYDAMAGVTASETKNGITTDLTNNIIEHIFDESGNDVTEGFIPNPGRYTIKYDVMDSNNNLAETKSRVVTIDSYSITKGVNTPLLAKGMVPIKWNGTTWVDTTASDSDWYNYDTTNKIWANARTQDGSMWVWIPRYIYKITSGWHSNTTGAIAVQFSKGTNDNWNSASIGNIDTGTTSNASNNKWTNHPGFTFGSTELTGIWVAKFEPTAVEGVTNGYTADGTCAVGDNVLTKTIKVIPNVASWRCIYIGNAFTVIRNMETKSVYGWITANTLKVDGTYTTDTNNLDTHLIKNIEWSSIAYLSKSNYGQGSNDIYINNSQTYITGCDGNIASASEYDGCQNTYETANGIKASTTGNIYGIYDLAGGSWENTSAYIDNGSGVLTTYASSILSSNSKYKDIYTKAATDNSDNNYALAINKKGDSIYETSSSSDYSNSWFSDNSYMPYSSTPLFIRGGGWNSYSQAGIFSFAYPNYYDHSSFGFRPILVVGQGL